MYRTLGDELLVRRVGEAEDVARAIVFLMADGYATGTTLTVDGGAALV